MLIKVLLGLAILVAIVLIVAAFQPSTFRVARQTSIAAAPSVIFPWVNELQKWRSWSPYERMDPAMKRTFDGPAVSAGAVYAWDGNDKVGSGRMTIVESRPSDLIRIKLEFFKPMSGVCLAEFTFKPDGAGTKVSWSMEGTNNYAAKLFCLFMNMDKMIGGQFEEGLANLKSACEAAGRH